jgi:hypothetical protein
MIKSSSKNVESMETIINESLKSLQKNNHEIKNSTQSIELKPYPKIESQKAALMIELSKMKSKPKIKSINILKSDILNKRINPSVVQSKFVLPPSNSSRLMVD